MIQEAYSCPLRIKEDKGEGVTAVLEIKEKKVKPRGYSAAVLEIGYLQLSCPRCHKAQCQHHCSPTTLLPGQIIYLLIKNLIISGPLEYLTWHRGKETTITYL